MKPGAGRQEGSPDREVLAGSVERVTFHNPENGFCVLRTGARGHRELVTVVGHAATVAAGEWITASGEWVNDRTHGQQFKARFIRTAEPSSVEGHREVPRLGHDPGHRPGLRGKILNVASASADKLRGNKEPDDLVQVLGCGTGARFGRRRSATSPFSS